MTTIAYRDGVLAADSWETQSSESGGSRRHICTKLYRKRMKKGRRQEEVIIAMAGESSPSLVFYDWYGSGKPLPEVLMRLDGDFQCLILTRRGLYQADVYCRPDLVLEPFYAIGSGAGFALGAMACGKSAREAVKIAARYDPYTGGRIVSMRLPEEPRQSRRSRQRQ